MHACVNEQLTTNFNCLSLSLSLCRWDEREGVSTAAATATTNNANSSKMENLKIADESTDAAAPEQQQQQRKGDKKKKEKKGGDGGDGKPKLSRAEIKAQRMAARQQKQQQQQEASDPLAGVKYGDLPLIQSQTLNSLTFASFDDLEQAAAAGAGAEVRLRGRIHTVRGKGKSAFVVLRDGTQTVQVRSR